MYPFTVQDLLSGVRTRIEDRSARSVADTTILSVADRAIASEMFTAFRTIAGDHNIEKLDIPIASLTPLSGTEYEWPLPEYVAAVRSFDRLLGSEVVPIVKLELEFRSQASEAGWYRSGRRRVTFAGNVAATPTIRLWYFRTVAPLHHGIAQGASAANKLQFSAAPTGKVVQRPDLYVGQDLVITNDVPVGNLDALRRITAYSGGATREVTVDSNWPVTPTSSTAYSLVLPFESEDLADFCVELVARRMFQDFGEIPPMPVYEKLEMQFSAALAEVPERRVWNYGD